MWSSPSPRFLHLKDILDLCVWERLKRHNIFCASLFYTLSELCRAPIFSQRALKSKMPWPPKPHTYDNKGGESGGGSSLIFEIMICKLYLPYSNAKSFLRFYSNHYIIQSTAILNLVFIEYYIWYFMNSQFEPDCTLNPDLILCYPN